MMIDVSTFQIIEYQNALFQGQTQFNQPEGLGILVTDAFQIFMGQFQSSKLNGIAIQINNSISQSSPNNSINISLFKDGIIKGFSLNLTLNVLSFSPQPGKCQWKYEIKEKLLSQENGQQISFVSDRELILHVQNKEIQSYVNSLLNGKLNIFGFIDQKEIKVRNKNLLQMGVIEGVQFVFDMKKLLIIEAGIIKYNVLNGFGYFRSSDNDQIWFAHWIHGVEQQLKIQIQNINNDKRMLIVYKDDQNIQELNMNKVLNCLASIHQLSVFYKNHQISPIQFNHLNSFTSNSDHKIIYPKSKQNKKTSNQQLPPFKVAELQYQDLQTIRQQRLTLQTEIQNLFITNNVETKNNQVFSN